MSMEIVNTGSKRENTVILVDGNNGVFVLWDGFRLPYGSYGSAERQPETQFNAAI